MVLDRSGSCCITAEHPPSVLRRLRRWRRRSDEYSDCARIAAALRALFPRLWAQSHLFGGSKQAPALLRVVAECLETALERLPGTITVPQHHA
jgi:hypothetical protein